MYNVHAFGSYLNDAMPQVYMNAFSRLWRNAMRLTKKKKKEKERWGDNEHKNIRIEKKKTAELQFAACELANIVWKSNNNSKTRTEECVHGMFLCVWEYLRSVKCAGKFIKSNRKKSNNRYVYYIIFKVCNTVANDVSGFSLFQQQCPKNW